MFIPLLLDPKLGFLLMKMPWHPLKTNAFEANRKSGKNASLKDNRSLIIYYDENLVADNDDNPFL